MGTRNRNAFHQTRRGLALESEKITDFQTSQQLVLAFLRGLFIIGGSAKQNKFMIFISKTGISGTVK